MRPSDVFSYRRSADRQAIGELLELEGRQLIFFNQRFVEGRSLMEIADMLNIEYSTVSHLSSDVNKLLANIDL